MKCMSKSVFDEKVNIGLANMLMTNLLSNIMVLHDEFGFGADRIDRFIIATTKQVQQIDEYALDGVLDKKISPWQTAHQDKLKAVVKETMRPYLSDEAYDMIFNCKLDSAKVIDQRCKQMYKEHEAKCKVSVAEAAKLQQQMQAAMAIVKEGDRETT